MLRLNLRFCFLYCLLEFSAAANISAAPADLLFAEAGCETAPQPLQGLDKIWLNGMERYYEADYSGALKWLERITLRYPLTEYDLEANYWIGLCEYKLGHLDQANKWFGSAVINSPHNSKVPCALYQQARVRETMKDGKGMRESLETLFSKYPDHLLSSDCWAQRAIPGTGPNNALLLCRGKDLMEKDCPLAEKIFSRILGSSSSDPSLPGALFYMAECERKEQRRDLSDPHYLEVIRKYPNSIFAKRAGEILEPSH